MTAVWRLSSCVKQRTTHSDHATATPEFEASLQFARYLNAPFQCGDRSEVTTGMAGSTIPALHPAPQPNAVPVWPYRFANA